MAIINYGDLVINGVVRSYEGAVKITPGSITRKTHPQINGSAITTSDISTNFSMITINVRVTPEILDDFRDLYNNGDNNTISFRDRNFSNCKLTVRPEEEDLGTADFVFEGDPEL